MAIKKIFKATVAFLLCAFIIFSAFVYGLYNVAFPKKYSDFVEYYSEAYNLETNMVYAVIKAESNFKADAVSNKNAKGLMQITGSTGKWAAELMGNEYFEEYMLFDEETNIEMGCWYLNRLVNNYGSTDIALAAYNAGSGNVSRWIKEIGLTEEKIDVIHFAETRIYVEKINIYKKIYDFLYK